MYYVLQNKKDTNTINDIYTESKIFPNNYAKKSAFSFTFMGGERPVQTIPNIGVSWLKMTCISFGYSW